MEAALFEVRYRSWKFFRKRPGVCGLLAGLAIGGVAMLALHYILASAQIVVG